jgi:hypothetical protein
MFGADLMDRNFGSNYLLNIVCVAVLGPLATSWVASGQGPKNPTPASQKISVVGEYDNFRFSEEHQYGYAVELWREGNDLFGFFSASAGLEGDTPTGLLEEVQYDPAGGKLSFKAKLSMGVMGIPDGEGIKNVPSRDLFQFEGTLRQGVLSGTLKHRMDFPKGPPAVEQIRLRKGTGEFMIQASTRQEWNQIADSILKARGPKWDQ